MTKLLHISANTYPPLNGKHHHTKNIWKELSKGFDEYHIIARSENNKYSFSKEGNICLHLVPRITKKSKIFFFTSFWMFYIIKKYKITHLLSQCPIVGGFNASLASKYFKIPLMVEIHGEEYFRFLEQKNFALKIMNFTFNQANKIRSLNKEMTKKLYKYGIENKVVEIYNRVNLDIFNKTKNNFEINDNCIKLVSVGRFVWEKNYLKLIENLSKSNLNYQLTLIGGGLLKKEYEKYINENNLTNIVLIDWIEQKDLIDLIVSSDVYIQYSISEGMPRTIIEAMALQMPIISTKVGSIEGVLEDNKNSILLDNFSKEELENQLNKLIENKNLRENIVKQAYQDVIDKYEWNKVFEIYRNELKSMKHENS